MWVASSTITYVKIDLCHDRFVGEGDALTCVVRGALHCANFPREASVLGAQAYARRTRAETTEYINIISV